MRYVVKRVRPTKTLYDVFNEEKDEGNDFEHGIQSVFTTYLNFYERNNYFYAPILKLIHGEEGEKNGKDLKGVENKSCVLVGEGAGNISNIFVLAYKDQFIYTNDSGKFKRSGGTKIQELNYWFGNNVYSYYKFNLIGNDLAKQGRESKSTNRLYDGNYKQEVDGQKESFENINSEDRTFLKEVYGNDLTSMARLNKSVFGLSFDSYIAKFAHLFQMYIEVEEDSEGGYSNMYQEQFGED